VWCEEMPLKEAFLGLYDIACNKNSLVAAHMILENGSFQWDVRFIRAVHDWEVDGLASFFTLLYSIRRACDGEDKLWWSPSRKGKFVLDISIRFLLTRRQLIFPGKVFGGPRFL
jgi:hypothetical protein